VRFPMSWLAFGAWQFGQVLPEYESEWGSV